MKYVSFSYKGDKWNCYLVPEKEADDFFEDDNTAAEVQFDKREIYINDFFINSEIVMHELFHMAVGYQYVKDSELTFHQSEELFCNLFAQEGIQLVELSKKLNEQLKKLKEHPEDTIHWNI